MAGKKRKKTKALGWQGQILLISMLLSGLAALASSILLVFGMLPTAVAFFIDQTENKTRVLTVGAMNFAGCAPFILQLWTTEHTVDNAFRIITDPRTIIVMYCAAGFGYMVDWAVSGLVATFMVSRAKTRREQIIKRKEELLARWGREVTGEIPVDHEGFPLEPEGAAEARK